MRTELLEDDRCPDDAEAGSARARRQEQGEDAEVGQRTPGAAVDAPVLAPREVLAREPVRAEPADGVLELELLFVEAEVHGPRCVARGLENI